MTSVNDDADQSKAESLGASEGKRSLAAELKWGRTVMNSGACVIPSLLLREQQKLGLTATQLVVLLNIIDFWWEEDLKPQPRLKTLASRMSMTERQARRHVAALERAGFIRRIERRAHHGGSQTNTYDLSGLVIRLQELE